MVTATAPQTTTTSDLSEIYFIRTVDGTEVEAIRIGLNPDGSVDLSGLAGKRDDLKEGYERFGVTNMMGMRVLPSRGAAFLKAMVEESRRNPYIIFRMKPELR